jgi:HPt (histidine-containing phosphotransfer) domain-containing protein
MLRQLVEVFLEEYPGLLAGVAREMEQGNQGAAAERVHALKGMTSNFSQGRVYCDIRDLERLLKDGQAAQALTTLATVLQGLQELATLLRTV